MAVPADNNRDIQLRDGGVELGGKTTDHLGVHGVFATPGDADRALEEYPETIMAQARECRETLEKTMQAQNPVRETFVKVTEAFKMVEKAAKKTLYGADAEFDAAARNKGAEHNNTHSL